MRTTIEMTDEHRAKLLGLAARRGKKGFSELVEEAIELYLETPPEARKARKRALRARGALSVREADELRATAERLRRTWR